VNIFETDGELQLADCQAGLFERWQNAIRYLIPETGEVFKVPRKAAPAGANEG